MRLCRIMIHTTAQNRIDNLPSYPPIIIAQMLSGTSTPIYQRCACATANFRGGYFLKFTTVIFGKYKHFLFNFCKSVQI